MNLAIFASGAGSNAEAIIRRINQPGSRHRVALVVTDRSDAGVIRRAQALGVDVEVIKRSQLSDRSFTTSLLSSRNIGFIALGGYLGMIPEWMVGEFDRRIVNIHPSLLPRHGGKGMYGHHVHEAVVACGDRESGITIHYVDQHYDSGQIILQAKVDVLPEDTAADVESHVRALEPLHYPEVVASLLDQLDPEK